MGFVKDAWNGITGKTAAKSAEKAGKMQSDSAKYAADLQNQQYQQTRQDQMPWLNAGTNALGKLSSYVDNMPSYKDDYGSLLKSSITNSFNGGGGLSGSVGASGVGSYAVSSGEKFNDKLRPTIQQHYDSGQYTGGLSLDQFDVDPGYNFRKQQGLDNIQASAAAGGGLLSGAALKALNEYNSNLASQEYNNAWQRNQAQKQQQFAVDTGLRGQDHGIFAEQAARDFQAASQNASLAQQAAMHNASLAQQASIANQNYQLGMLGVLQNARAQDYSMFSSEDARRYNALANLAGVGQQTANNLATLGASNANNMGSLAMDGANARANGLTTGAYAKSQGMGNLLGLGMKAFGLF